MELEVWEEVVVVELLVTDVIVNVLELLEVAVVELLVADVIVNVLELLDVAVVEEVVEDIVPEVVESLAHDSFRSLATLPLLQEAACTISPEHRAWWSQCLLWWLMLPVMLEAVWRYSLQHDIWACAAFHIEDHEAGTASLRTGGYSKAAGHGAVCSGKQHNRFKLRVRLMIKSSFAYSSADIGN